MPDLEASVTEEQLKQIPRLTAAELLASIPLGPGIEQRTALAVEAAMTQEWWRGYWAGRAAAETKPAIKPSLP